MKNFEQEKSEREAKALSAELLANLIGQVYYQDINDEEERLYDALTDYSKRLREELEEMRVTKRTI